MEWIRRRLNVPHRLKLVTAPFQLKLVTTPFSGRLPTTPFSFQLQGFCIKLSSSDFGASPSGLPKRIR